MGTHPIFESDFDCLTAMDININDFGQPSGVSQQPTYSHPQPIITGSQVEYSRPMAPSFTTPTDGTSHSENQGSLHRPRYPPIQNPPAGYNYAQPIYPSVIFFYFFSSRFHINKYT